MGEGFAWLDLTGESEKSRPHRIAKPAVGDCHVQDRLSVGGNALPNTKRLEQPAHRSNDRGGAFVIGGATAEARVGDGNGEGVAERLPQSDGKREPGEAAAGNQDIEIRTRHGRALAQKDLVKKHLAQKRLAQKLTQNQDNRTAAANINSSLTDLLRGDR
jgi:hypothetical protein